MSVNRRIVYYRYSGDLLLLDEGVFTGQQRHTEVRSESETRTNKIILAYRRQRNETLRGWGRKRILDDKRGKLTGQRHDTFISQVLSCVSCNLMQL